eukprot:gene7204-biopygen6100
MFILRWLVILAVWGVIAGGGMLVWFAWDLPRADAALDAARRPSLTIQARDGRIIATFGDVLGLPCVPVALNSGLYWPRRKFLRRPGIIRIEILPPIAPGLDKAVFHALLQERIETTSDRLLALGRAELAALGLDPLATTADTPRQQS